MKHVRVRITAHGRAGNIHPMYGVMTEAPFVKRATAVQWNYTGDTLGILHYVVGDADALERTMQEFPEVVDYDMERIDERSCYVYVRDTTTDSLQELFSPISSGGLIVVPPSNTNLMGPWCSRCSVLTMRYRMQSKASPSRLT